jgi:hypothetical protein
LSIQLHWLSINLPLVEPVELCIGNQNQDGCQAILVEHTTALGINQLSSSWTRWVMRWKPNPRWLPYMLKWIDGKQSRTYKTYMYESAILDLWQCWSTKPTKHFSLMPIAVKALK